MIRTFRFSLFREASLAFPLSGGASLAERTKKLAVLGKPGFCNAAQPDGHGWISIPAMKRGISMTTQGGAEEGRMRAADLGEV
jgi:hypothetical protein